MMSPTVSYSVESHEAMGMNSSIVQVGTHDRLDYSFIEIAFVQLWLSLMLLFVLLMANNINDFIICPQKKKKEQKEKTSPM